MLDALDSALILRRFAYGESSLVLHVLAREHGRVHLLAKGAYRTTSRYYAALDLFDTLELGWPHAPTRELQVLREASIRVRRHRIATDLPSYEAALTVLELAGVGAPENAPAHDLFDATSRALDELLLGVAPNWALIQFELRLLHNLGLAPALVRCAACGGEAPALERDGADEVERAAFSAGAGGRLCPTCAVEARAVGRRVGTLPTRVLELAQACQTSTHGPPADCDAQTLENTRDFVARFLEYHLEGRPVSYRRFLAVPNRNRPSA